MEPTAEIDALDIALQSCNDLKEELNLMIKNVHELNKKYNPEFYFTTLEFDTLNSHEDDIITEISIDLSNSTSSDTINSSAAENQHVTEMGERTCSEISQIYSAINFKMIKLKRSAESVWNCIRRVIVTFENSMFDYARLFVRPYRRSSDSMKIMNKEIASCHEREKIEVDVPFRPMTRESPPKLKSRIFTLRTLSR